MGRKVIRMETSSLPVGPYSPGAGHGGLLYTSGQTSLDPRGQVLGVGDVRVQTVETLKNLVAVLAAGGATLKDVLKTTVFLTDMRHYEAMNEEYARFFPADPPARSTVQMPLALPELLVEIEAIALPE